MRDGLGEGTIENLVCDWASININPFSQVARNVENPLNLAWGLNYFLGSSYSPFRTRTTFEIKSRGFGDISWNAARVQDPKLVYPHICDTAALASFDTLTKRIAYRAKAKRTPKTTQISELARYLGLTHTASCHVAQVCENLGPVSVGMIVKEVGCHQRSLQRKLREEGTTLEMIVQGSRLIRATALFRSGKSLTEIAHETGFFDLAHMDRAFHVSAGVSPGFLRRLAQGAIEPELI